MAQSFITCSCCNKREDLEAYRLINTPIVAKMRGEQLCFNCAYWKSWVLNPEPDTAVISGSLYKITEPFCKPTIRQSRSKYIQLVADAVTHEVHGCYGLVLRGHIPAHLSSLLPDQYKFISPDQYKRIAEYDAERCLSKGCFDRYHCLWYDAKVSEPIEPWNTIPKNYKIGSELCPSFIDKYDILNNP